MKTWIAPEWDPQDPDACRPLPSDQRAIEEGYVYDPSKAKVVRDFAETLCLQRRPPFRDQPLALMPWQRTHLLNPLFGWIHSETGLRRFRRLSAWTPKKNGKTQTAAALALYLTCEEEAAATYWIATTAEQAKETLYHDLAYMAGAHPAFGDRFWRREHLKEISDRETGSVVKILAAKPESADGYNGNVILDEFAALSPNKAAALWGKVRYANASRPNGLITTISTAQYNRSSIAYDHFIEARKAERETGHNHRLLPIVFALDEEAGESWQDPDVWARVNPSAGVTFPVEQLREAYEEAAKTPQGEHDFRCLRCNQWAGSADRWFTQAAWDKCVSETDPEELRTLCANGEAEAIVACDWGRSVDLGYTVVLVRHGEQVHVVESMGWIPEELVGDRSKTDGIDYRSMIRADALTATPGNVVDCGAFVRWIVEAAGAWHTTRIGYDPSKFEATRQILDNEGLSTFGVSNHIKVVGPASNKLEELVVSGRLRHPDDPLLNVCFANVRSKVSDWGDFVRPDKPRKGEKIDGVMAVVYGLCLLYEEGDAEPDIYVEFA